MQRLSIGSSGGKPRLDTAAADEKAGKPAVRAAPDKSIHLIPLLTLLCFLVLFLLSHDPAYSSSSLNDSPVLAVTARSLEAKADATASMGRGSGVYRRLKEDPMQARGEALGSGQGRLRQRS